MSGYTLVNILGGLLIVTSMVVLMVKGAKPAAICYGLQSCVLVGIFLALATVTDSEELLKWAGSAFVTKALIVPGIIIFLSYKIKDAGSTLAPRVSGPFLFVIAAIEVGVCLAVVQAFDVPTAQEVKPALAISLAHFLIGMTCIVSQRNIVKQIFGYCLMENGSHLTLALLAPNAPELVEIGISTDAFIAVIIMAVACYRVYKVAHTLNAEDLMELKG